MGLERRSRREVVDVVLVQNSAPRTIAVVQQVSGAA